MVLTAVTLPYPFPAAEAGRFCWSLVPTVVAPYSPLMMREQHCQTLLMRRRPRRAGGHGVDGGGCEVHIPVRLELAALAALRCHVLRDRSCCCGGCLEGGACSFYMALVLVLDAESYCLLHAQRCDLSGEANRRLEEDWLISQASGRTHLSMVRSNNCCLRMCNLTKKIAWDAPEHTPIGVCNCCKTRCSVRIGFSQTATWNVQAGMDKQLRTLVDLEALLNDGTAYVLFFLLRVWAEGRHQTASDAVKCGRRALSIYRTCMLCSRSLADLAGAVRQLARPLSAGLCAPQVCRRVGARQTFASSRGGPPSGPGIGVAMVTCPHCPFLSPYE